MDIGTETYIAAESVVGLFTFVGNLLVLVAIYKDSSLHTVTNCFIASLATADMFVGLIVTPLAVVSIFGYPHHFLGCVFTNSTLIAFTQVSIFNLLAVAIERFIAIKSPFLYKRFMTFPKAIAINAVVWFFGLLFGFLPVFGWNLQELYGAEWFCSFDTTIDMNYVVYFHFFACTVVPLLIIMAIYVYIFIIVRKQLTQIATLDVSTSNQLSGNINSNMSRFIREIKAAKSLALVILLFGVCWIPLHVLNVLNITCGVNCYPLELMLATIVLSHANSAVNPFLYAYGNSCFKSAFRKMFCKSSTTDVVAPHTSVIPSMSKNVNTVRTFSLNV